MIKLNTKELSKLMKGKEINEIVKAICGKKIGAGIYRDVYVLKQNSNFVVKVERKMGLAQFANATEWRHYIDNREWEWFEQYLAPCELITLTGQILIQRRIEHRGRKEYPKEIPAMFTDIKIENFGWIEDRFVCCDYSFIPFYIIKTGNSKMKKARWRRK